MPGSAGQKARGKWWELSAGGFWSRGWWFGSMGRAGGWQHGDGRGHQAPAVLLSAQDPAPQQFSSPRPPVML